MSDTVNFTGSGEMDNGWTVTMTMGLDSSAVAAGAGLKIEQFLLIWVTLVFFHSKVKMVHL